MLGQPQIFVGRHFGLSSCRSGFPARRREQPGVGVPENFGLPNNQYFFVFVVVWGCPPVLKNEKRNPCLNGLLVN